MESNLLINHPASLDTVTRLWRGDSDACIPVHLRISQTALYHCSMYVCISNHLCRQFYIWDATEAGEQLFFCRHPFRPDSHSFPTTCVLLQSLRFLALDVIASFANVWLYSISTSAARFPPEENSCAAEPQIPDFSATCSKIPTSHLQDQVFLLANSPQVFKCYVEIWNRNCIIEGKALLIFY